MDERGFKNQILGYSLIVAGIAWLVSLIFLRIDVQFLYGLALGTFVSFVNLNILIYTSKLVLRKRKPAVASLGLVLRLCIYGAVFYVAFRVSVVAGIGCLMGFLTQKIAIVYIYGVKAKYSVGRKVSPEVAAEYERMDREKEKKWNT